MRLALQRLDVLGGVAGIVRASGCVRACLVGRVPCYTKDAAAAVVAAVNTSVASIIALASRKIAEYFASAASSSGHVQL